MFSDYTIFNHRIIVAYSGDMATGLTTKWSKTTIQAKSIHIILNEH